MASGDLLDVPTPNYPAGTAVPSYGQVDGGSTPAEALDTFDFGAGSAEYLDFYGRLSERYSGTGVTVTFTWFGKAGTSGNVVWTGAFRRINSAETLSGLHTYSTQSATTAVAGTLTRASETGLTFSDGAQMDSLAAGEPYVLRVARPTGGSDTLTGDAQLAWRTVRVTET